MAGVKPGDRCQMAFGYGMFTGGFGLHYGLQKLGCMMIPAGSGNTERHLQMINDYGTTVLIATPSYALMCEVGEKKGFDWASSSLRIGLFGGEPCPPKMKEEIERRMHSLAQTTMVSPRLWVLVYLGNVFAQEICSTLPKTISLWEVVDPKTGEPVPEGVEGRKLVITPLDKERYSCTSLPHPRPYLRCYREMRMRSQSRSHEKVRKRSDDMLIIRGTNVFPSRVEDILSGIKGSYPVFTASRSTMKLDSIA